MCFPRYQSENGDLVVENRCGKLTLALPPHPSFFLCKTTGRLFAMIAGGDCSAVGRHDEVSAVGEWRTERQADGTLLIRREDISPLWEKKCFCIRVTASAFSWYHELTGEGMLEDIRWFRGCFMGYEYGFAGNFDEIYSAAPNFWEKQWFHPCDRVVISNGTDCRTKIGMHALASVPHVMGLHDRRDRTQMGVAVFAEPGEYLWDDMVWNPDVVIPPSDYEGDLTRAGGFAIRYCGKKHVRGSWRSPQLVFTFPETVEKTLAEALEYAYGANLLPRPGKHENAPWWSEPIYCTWDDQTAATFKGEGDFHRLEGACPGIYASEYWTERWLKKLLEHNIKPGIIILDDKWQKSKLAADPDPEKWPDMRRWIDSCHRRGIRVFLWELAWHKEDIPAEEAITRDGEIVAGDVTNPLYEKRLREKMHRYFSDGPGCLDADGVKIDGLMALPTGPGLKNHENLWGLELQRRFLEIVRSEAKKAKPDACISTFAANPYLDEFTDMVRLGDMFVSRLSTEESMRVRHAVFRTTDPFVPIDTDSQINYNTDPDYLHAWELGAELGIPTIYNAEFVRRSRYFFLPEYRTLTEKEYEKIAGIFSAYRRRRGKSSAGEKR